MTISLQHNRKYRGAGIIAGSILVGLILAHLLLMSEGLAALVLSAGIALGATVFLRKTDYLIYAWFVSTSLLSVFMLRLLPLAYYDIVGRGIFWGGLGCIIAAWAIDNVMTRRRFEPFSYLSLKVVILVFFIWASMTMFTSLNVLYSLRKLSHIVIALLTSYMFYDFFSRDEGNIRRVIVILALVITGVSLITIYLGTESVISGVPVYKRLSLWFRNPNTLGIILFVSIPILYSGALPMLPNTGARLAFAALPLLALFFSFSRASWLATMGSLAFLSWRGRLKLPISAAVVVGFIVLALMAPVFGERVFEFVTGEQYSGRAEIWGAALTVARHKPVFGTGLGNSMYLIPQYIETPWLKGQDCHSVYLKNAVEMGFASVALLLAIYGVFFAISGKIERALRSEDLRLLTRGARAMLFGLMIHGIFENGILFTAFDAGEFTVILPYIAMAIPFAAERLEARARMNTTPLPAIQHSASSTQHRM